MFRVKISNFIKNNSDKIKDLGTKLGIVAIVVFIATILLSSSSNKEEEKKDLLNAYKPTDTVIKGTDISEKQYEEDSNVVERFLEFCNNKEVEAAYNLLTKECIEETYPTLEDFKKYYYNDIFNKKREYNLQAWISTQKYTVYKIRYTNNMLATGKYEQEDVYQDYITLNKIDNQEKISIGNFIYAEDSNIVTKTKEIEAVVTKKKVYISYEEYNIQIKNNTDKTILLDNLERSNTIRLIANQTQYLAYTNKLFPINLTINAGASKNITIRFKRSLSSGKESDRIEFLKVIKDLEAYEENKKDYTDTINIKIKLED